MADENEVKKSSNRDEVAATDQPVADKAMDLFAPFGKDEIEKLRIARLRPAEERLRHVESILEKVRSIHEDKSEKPRDAKSILEEVRSIHEELSDKMIDLEMQLDALEDALEDAPEDGAD